MRDSRLRVGLRPGESTKGCVGGSRCGDAGYPFGHDALPGPALFCCVLCNSRDTSPTSFVRKVSDIYLGQEMKEPEQSAGAATAAQVPEPTSPSSNSPAHGLTGTVTTTSSGMRT